MRAGARHHHMVDWSRQVEEESLQRSRIVGVEGRAAKRAEFARGALQALGVPGGEDDVGSLGARPSRCFEPDACASSDDDDRLPEEFRFALGARSQGCVVHGSSDWKSRVFGLNVSPIALSLTPCKSAFTILTRITARSPCPWRWKRS